MSRRARRRHPASLDPLVVPGLLRRGLMDVSQREKLHQSTQATWRSFRANVRWEKATVVDADLLCHEIVQQAVHPQDRRPVLLRFDGQVVQFVGVALQVEKLDVVALEY